MIFLSKSALLLTTDFPNVVPKQNVAKQGNEHHANPTAVVPAKCHDDAQNCQRKLRKQDDVFLGIALPESVFLLVQPQLLDLLVVKLGKAVIGKADADIE